MSEKIYLIFLILCGILLGGISGSFFEDNNNNSSNLHVRKKRTVGHDASGHGDWIINGITHIVQVLFDNVKICAGVIVTPEHILTPYECIRGSRKRFIIDSRATPLSDIQPHFVNRIESYEDIAFLIIHPYILGAGSSLARPIVFAGHSIRASVHPAIIAWWFDGRIRPITNVLRVDLVTCRNRYREHNIEVTANYYCTFLPHDEHRLSDADAGSALVVGDEFYGVLVRAGVDYGPFVPDLFANVDGMEYSQWITSHIWPYLHNPQLYNQQNHIDTEPDKKRLQGARKRFRWGLLGNH